MVLGAWSEMERAVKILLRLEKETKGALRYQEIGEDGLPLVKDFLMGTVYLRKSALVKQAFSSDRFPKGLTLDVTFED